MQIDWTQVDLPAGLITLEAEQTKGDTARTVPLPDVLIGMLEMVADKSGNVFDGTNLRKAWQNACVAAGLGTLTKIEGKRDPRYTGLLIHDLRRSAVRNLRKAGVPEVVAMKISGHKTRNVFDRYNIVDTNDVVDAMRRVQGNSVKQVSIAKPRRPVKPKALIFNHWGVVQLVGHLTVNEDGEGSILPPQPKFAPSNESYRVPTDPSIHHRCRE